MKKLMLICLFLLFAWECSLAAAPVVWNVKPAKSFFKGNGSANDPYIISSVEEFALMASYSLDTTKRGKYYSLRTDIVINEGNASDWGTTPPKYKWISLGDSLRYASLNLDGNGHTISGLYVNSQEDFQGLFGKVNGGISNLNVVNSFIKGGNYVGTVAGQFSGSPGVSNVFVEAIVEGLDYVGGVAGVPYFNGILEGGAVSRAVFKGSVKGQSYVGGIFAIGNAFYNERGVASYCDNYGSVTGTGKYIGGIFGAFMIDVSDATLYKLKNFGTVSGSQYVGGIGGLLFLDRDPEVGHVFNFSYLRNMGEIFGNTYVGGLFGEYYSGRSYGGHTIDYSYNAGRVKGSLYVDPLFSHSKWQGEHEESAYIKQKTYNFAEAYKGSLVLVDDRKTSEELINYADSLGAYYIPDTGAVKLNHGYPLLIAENKNFSYLKGTGTASDPYLISNMDDLIKFGSHARAVPGSYYKQTADIAYDTSRNWLPATVNSLYYDGDGHKITNFKSVWSDKCAGLVDTALANPFSVENLELADVHVDGHYEAGALACRANSVNLSNIKVSGTVVARRYSGLYSISGSAGGVIGQVQKGFIKNVENYADVTGPKYAGGIYGYGFAELHHVENYGNIKSSEYAGGITGAGGKMMFTKNYGNIVGYRVGGISSSGRIVGSFNRGDVKGSRAGGISSSPVVLSNVYSTGNVITDSLKACGMIVSEGNTTTTVVEHAYYEKKGVLGISGTRNIFSMTFVDTASFTQKQFLEKDVVKKMGDFFAYDEMGENDGYPIFYEGFKGNGTAESPYLITSKEELLKLSSIMNDTIMNFYYLDKSYRLTKDIVFDDSDDWVPIGSKKYVFQGEFDGDNHVIAGLNMGLTGTSKPYASIFGSVSGTVKNLGVENSKFVGDTAAAFVSILDGGRIRDCWNRNSEVEGKVYAGGIAALAQKGFTFDRVFNTGTVKGPKRVGGIASEIMYTNSYRATISNSFNVGEVQINGRSNGSLTTLIGITYLPEGLTLKKVYTIATVKPDSKNDYSKCDEFGVNVFYLQSDSLDTNGLTQEFMKSRDFVELLGPEFAFDSTKVNDGYPVLANSKALFKQSPRIGDEPKVVGNIPLFNVVSGSRMISLSGLAEKEKVTVVNVNGKTVWSGRAAGSELVVPVNAPGIYFVKVKSQVAKVLVR